MHSQIENEFDVFFQKALEGLDAMKKYKCECGEWATKKCKGEDCEARMCDRHAYNTSGSGEKDRCSECFEIVLYERYLEFVGGRAG